MQNHTTAITKNRFRTIGWPWLMFRTGSARLQARQPESAPANVAPTGSIPGGGPEAFTTELRTERDPVRLEAWREAAILDLEVQLR
jgi:hypothetical protein